VATAGAAGVGAGATTAGATGTVFILDRYTDNGSGTVTITSGFDFPASGAIFNMSFAIELLLFRVLTYKKVDANNSSTKTRINIRTLIGDCFVFFNIYKIIAYANTPDNINIVS
jgi:hypothetical protein